MPHLPRIHTPGLYYHVYARGNNRDPIFFDERDYRRFLTKLEEYRRELPFVLYAYCLLPNHFHILLKVKKYTLTTIMQKLMTSYTMYINKKHDRVGHVFQGRYQSIIVEKETYLLQVLRYIHLNPVKAGFVDLPHLYPWSSYSYYLSNQPTHPRLKTNEILGMFSENTSKQKQLFQEFTLGGIGSDFDPLKDHIRGILGGDKIFKKLAKSFKGSYP